MLVHIPFCSVSLVFEQRDAVEFYEKILYLTSPEASQVKKSSSNWFSKGDKMKTR